MDNSSLLNPNRPSFRSISLTQHARQRAMERINVTSKEQLQKMALSAKLKGSLISTLAKDNYKSRGLTLGEFKYLKNHYATNASTSKSYYRNGIVYVFCGNHSRTLRTVVKVDDEEMREWISKYVFE